MISIKRKANLIVEHRKTKLRANSILEKMLNIFEVYESDDRMVWQVSLVRDGDSSFCRVAFSNESDSIYFSKECLLGDDPYITLEPSHPLILAMEEVNSIATKEIFYDVEDYLPKTVLENFKVLRPSANIITIQMDEKAICEQLGLK